MQVRVLPGSPFPDRFVSGLALSRIATSEFEQSSDRALEIAFNLGRAIDRQILSFETVLAALATSPSFDRADLTAVYEQAAKALLPRKANVILVDRDGDQLFNSLVPTEQNYQRSRCRLNH